LSAQLWEGEGKWNLHGGRVGVPSGVWAGSGRHWSFGRSVPGSARADLNGTSQLEDSGVFLGRTEIRQNGRRGNEVYGFGHGGTPSEDWRLLFLLCAAKRQSSAKQARVDALPRNSDWSTSSNNTHCRAYLVLLERSRTIRINSGRSWSGLASK